MKYGVIYFSSDSNESHFSDYQFLIQTAKLADKLGFHRLWVPERHFHSFGGIFPNPTMVLAALAMVTKKIRLSAGSLISPLHHVIRMTENLSVVDNLSNGRLDVSFGSGWNVNDFVFFPERYEDRKQVMYNQIQDLKTLWEGAPLNFLNTYNKDVEITLYPKPRQISLPIWITISGNEQSYIQAGTVGANILTHMIGQDLETLKYRIQLYYDALENAGFDKTNYQVSLMLHTFVGNSEEDVLNKARIPLREYLRNAVNLENKAADGGGAISGGHRVPTQKVPEDILEELLDITFERYYHHASLLGTPEKCKTFIRKIEEAGVTEVACLMDFGVKPQFVKESMKKFMAEVV